MLDKKVALITGSTSGIGLATAHVLAKHGVNLVIHGLLSDQEGQALAIEFEQTYKVNTHFSNANLKEPTEISSLVTDAVNVFGGIDILINNAGIQHTERTETFPTEKWNDILAINLSAAFHLIQQTLPHMTQNRWGRIINIASVHGLVASKNKSAYCAAKHGIIGLTKVVALENAENGITANSICPGWVDTPLINKQIEDIANQQGLPFEEARYALVTEKQPLPEMAIPQQIGEFIRFLCSDAAKAITGSSLPMDGAWTAQ